MGGFSSPSQERDAWYMPPAREAGRTGATVHRSTAPRPRTRGEVDLAGRRERSSGSLELLG